MNPATHSKYTPQQLAEYQAVRREHEANPMREAPKTAIKRQSFMAIMKLLGGLKAARESQGLAVADVAAQMGIEPDALSRLESGNTFDPTITTLFRWSEVLGQKLAVDLGPDA